MNTSFISDILTIIIYFILNYYQARRKNVTLNLNFQDEDFFANDIMISADANKISQVRFKGKV